MAMLSHTKFKIWCKEQGFTAVDVAQRLGVSKSTVDKMWQGRIPSRKVEKKIHDEFGIDTKKMFNIL